MEIQSDKIKASAYEDQIKTLYEEMELQIGNEKDKLLAAEKQKERRLRDELEEKLQIKDQQLQELFNKQSELQAKLNSLNSVEFEARNTSDKLLKEKETLHRQLLISQEAISELQKNLEFVRQQSKEDKLRRAKTAMNMSESIALEREELVKQLETLRVINKQLQDEKDEQLERYSQSHSTEGNEKSSGGEILILSPTDSGLASSHGSVKSKLLKRGSIMSNYILNNTLRSSPGIQSPFAQSIVSTDDGIELEKHTKRNFKPVDEGTSYPSFGKTGNGSFRPYVKQETDPILGEITNPGVNPLMEEFLSSQPAESLSTAADEDDEELWNIQTHRQMHRKPLSVTSRTESVSQKISDPQRVFKVVFIGDSGVGKSSFIHRYCNHTFRATFSTTIGVDFQIKHVNCDGQTVVMQLWDTAGQERFRSITHQYMRKADGVVIMYDITSETSFKNVRNWITCVRSTAEEDTVVLLIGNKLDMCTSSSHRAVKSSDGMRLAEESYGLYFETSVKENFNVDDSMEELAMRLREKQDLQLEKALHLHLREKKKKCCF